MAHHSFKSLFILSLLFAVALVGNAKTCKLYVVPNHQIDPKSTTEVLSEKDSLIIYACPDFANGIIQYDTKDGLTKTLKKIEAYLTENPVEGEYTLWPIDADSKKGIAYHINTKRLNSGANSDDSEAVRMAKGDARMLLNDILFIVAAIVLAIAAYYLFSLRKLGIFGKILGVIAAIIAAYLGIVGVLAVAMLAFKYIFIVIGAVLALVILFGVFMSIGKGKSEKEVQHGWRSDGGVVYGSREAAEKNSTDPNNVRMV